MRDIDKYQDILDIRDVIARIEELRDESSNWGPAADEWREEDPSLADNDDSTLDPYLYDREDLQELESFVEEFKGYGGDHEWEGDWYPVTLVRDSYFKEFAEQEAEELDLIKRDATWPNNCIDWEKAARELQFDYTAGYYDGVKYWGRSA